MTGGAERRLRGLAALAVVATAFVCAMPARSGGRVPGVEGLYVVPAERVLAELSRARGRAVALHLEAELLGETPPDWPRQVEMDVHPQYGLRVSDLAGGKWVVRRERLVAGNRLRLPEWVPQIEVLVLPADEGLRVWLQAAGVDLQRNELGRCGPVDCFVVGGREVGRPQLWVGKDAFQIRRWVSATGQSFDFGAYREWGRQKFPSEISILSGDTARATLAVRALEPAPALGERDFSRAWTDL